MRIVFSCFFGLAAACTHDDPSPLTASTANSASTGAVTGTDAMTGTDAVTGTDAATETDAGVTTSTSAGTSSGTDTSAQSGSSGSDTDTSTDSGSSTGPEVEPPCTSVEQLAVANGLTPAMRQLSGSVTGPLLPPGPSSLLEYSTLYGTSANTHPVDEPDPTGFGFPGTNQNRLTFSLERDKYVALQFRAPTDGSWDQRTGSFFLIPAGTFVSAAIGRCPGQFADDPAWPMPLACRGFGETNVSWKIGGAPPSCALEPGATYYVNVINASLDDPATSVCDGDTCKFKLMNNHIDP